MENKIMRYIINEDELYHYAKGKRAKKHKYIAIKNGRYIYPEDIKPSRMRKKDILYKEDDLGKEIPNQKAMEQRGKVAKSHLEASKGGYERIQEEHTLYKPGTKYYDKGNTPFYNGKTYGAVESNKLKYYDKQRKQISDWKRDSDYANDVKKIRPKYNNFKNTMSLLFNSKQGGYIDYDGKWTDTETPADKIRKRKKSKKKATAKAKVSGAKTR